MQQRGITSSDYRRAVCLFIYLQFYPIRTHFKVRGFSQRLRQHTHLILSPSLSLPLSLDIQSSFDGATDVWRARMSYRTSVRVCVDAYVCVCSEYQCFSWLTGLFHLTALTLGSPISPHTDGLQAKIQFNLQQYPDPKFQCNPDPDHVQGKLLCNISFQLQVAAESKLIVRGSF